MNRYLYRNHKGKLKSFPNCHLVKGSSALTMRSLEGWGKGFAGEKTVVADQRKQLITVPLLSIISRHYALVCMSTRGRQEKCIYSAENLTKKSGVTSRGSVTHYDQSRGLGNLVRKTLNP